MINGNLYVKWFIRIEDIRSQWNLFTNGFSPAWGVMKTMTTFLRRKTWKIFQIKEVKTFHDNKGIIWFKRRWAYNQTPISVVLLSNQFTFSSLAYLHVCCPLLERKDEKTLGFLSGKPCYNKHIFTGHSTLQG